MEVRPSTLPAAHYKVCPACRARSAAEALYCPSCGFELGAVSVSDGDPYIGLVLAEKYVLEQLIGEGAMGRVYKAKQVTLGKPFAVKILAPHLMNDEQSAARFANEAHNAASLNHPNCVSVVDYGRSPDGITFIVMEYIRGRTLEELIVKEHPLSRERIVDLTLQILAALTEAHGLGILHRDLKPENILVQQLRTHGELAKVLDFGIAKLMEEQASASSRLTSQGMVCGTPEYMSPEQARGQTLDVRSDLYSVGVILYQMLTGRPPFESSSAVEVLHKHLHEDPVPPSAVLGTAPDPLEAVCLRALAKDPNARFGSAAEFREGLIGTTKPSTALGIQCTHCGAEMRPDHRFCPSCGKPSQTVIDRPRRRPHQRGSGITIPHRREAPTAEVVVRNFPLPLHGRDDAQQRARALLVRRDPAVHVRVLQGPRGVGKTRLGDEIAAMAESLGWRAHYVAADPTGARIPLWPIRVMVAQLLEFDLDNPTTQDLGRVANLTGLAFEELPGLAELFDLHGPAHDLELKVRRRECFASAVGALLSGGRTQPLLLIFDDVDGFDTPSREILRRLTSSNASHPVVVLAMTSETDVGWLGGLVEHLQPLDARAIEQACRSVAQKVNPTSRLPEALARKAPLNPLTLENHLRLLASGRPAVEDLSEEALLQARLDELDEVALNLLELASVLGERFLESDLVDLFERDTSSMRNLDRLDEALTRLHLQGVLLVIGHGERAFSHPLLREAVYANMTLARRRELHRLAARVPGIGGRSATVRAVHLVRGGSTAAVEDLADAANGAERCFDDDAAAEYLLAALDACGRLGDDKTRRQLATRLTLHAARVLRGPASRRAIELIEDALHRSSGDPAAEAALLRALGEAHVRLEQFDAGIDALQRGLGPAIALGDRAAMLEIYHELGRAHACRGDRERAIVELEEGLDMCTMGEGPRADTDLELWRYLLRLCELQRAQGRLAEARRWCEHALHQAERRGSRLGQLRCHAQLAWVLRDLKQSALAEQHLARGLEEARHFGDRLTTAELLIERARARAARGRLAEAKRCCEEALRLARGIQWASGVEHAERAIGMLTRSASA